ncbi:transmembrane protein 79-like isoform X2 [Channa argus]|uniref:transmembrane protein 79-like isoform X2 n=1 Tax=Channa argus TaxID=215402 RepID=UPI003521E7FD
MALPVTHLTLPHLNGTSGSFHNNNRQRRRGRISRKKERKKKKRKRRKKNQQGRHTCGMDGGTRQTNGEHELAGSTWMEPSTLQWPGEKQTGGQTAKGNRTSLRSCEAASWTESERALTAEGGRGAEVEGEVLGSSTHLEESVENHLPEKAAQVFSPAVDALSSPSSQRQSEAMWEMQSEKSPFLSPRGLPQDFNQHDYQFDWTEGTPPTRCGQGCPSRDALKVGVSLMTSALLFPFLVWGGFMFLPFDAPLMDGAPLRLIYSLRCSVFATIPIVLGWLVLAASRIRSGAFRPLFDDQLKEVELQDITVHRRFISDSVSLFLMYLVQLVVMTMYLSQEHLKVVPLLTVVFTFGRLVYWLAAAFGSSVRGFGFGLSFLPSLVMMVANIYFIFTVEAAGSIFSLPAPTEEELSPLSDKQRFWG